MSRAKTEEEIKEEFLTEVENISHYWTSLPNKTNKERCEGVAFSIMVLLDGCSALPAINMHIAPHEDDKQYYIESNEDYYKDNMMFNNSMLHEQIFKNQRKKI